MYVCVCVHVDVDVGGVGEERRQNGQCLRVCLPHARTLDTWSCTAKSHVRMHARRLVLAHPVEAIAVVCLLASVWGTQ